MPYDIGKSGGKWVVRKRSNGQVIGKHASRRKALSQVRAIYANEKKGKAEK